MRRWEPPPTDAHLRQFVAAEILTYLQARPLFQFSDPRCFDFESLAYRIAESLFSRPQSRSRL